MKKEKQEKKPKMKLSKKDTFKMIYHWILIIFGNILLAFGTAAFLVPYNIVTGGLSGLAIVMQSWFGGENYIDIIIFALNWILFFIGLIFLGKKFSIQTLLSVIIYPFALTFIMRVVKPETWLVLPEGDFSNFLAAIAGSAFTGLGCAITFKGGGSTGGVDVLSFIIQKYLKIKCSITAFVIDAIIIITGFITFRNLPNTIIGILGAFICALMIEKIFIGNSSTYIANIVSDKYLEINNFITTEMERGCTILDGQGGYSGEEKKMIVIAFDRSEYTKLIENINKIDSTAFVTVTLTHEVNGEGFDSFPKAKL